ncbi:MAG: acetolactate synthase large subunit, partial [Candidatus Omnitrophica bacterium]|nr:acetolactate synthase large subunit [Candidatus Omnitrophota bacterium]
TNPDFKKYAESFGIQGYRPQGLSELKSQLAHSLQKKELSVFEIPIDTSVNVQLIQKLKAMQRV